MGNSSISTMTSVASQQRITQAIKNVAARTGSDFADLLHKAAIESGFNTNAKAKTSSATGLFQFTGQTWLHIIKAQGAGYGLGNYADHIQVGSNGKAYVSDPVWQEAILDLRQDPQISTEMACELDKENSQKLRETIGGTIGSTELYLAHFLGASGASAFLKAMRASPTTKAADVLPSAALANRSVFYGADGQSRSVAQIYRAFAQKLDQPLADVMSSDRGTSTVSPLPPGFVKSEAISLFARILGPMDMADLTSTFVLDAGDDESEISVLV